MVVGAVEAVTVTKAAADVLAR
jgi:hypothetical protein